MTKHNWQDIYLRGEQLNRYPYDFIVSQFLNFKANNKKETLKVLDLGCGAGNHSIFCAENGAQVYAVDFSNAALSELNKRAQSLGLEELITTAKVDFENFNIEGSGFDFIIDRLSVSHTSQKYAKEVYEHVYSLLNKEGRVASVLFSTGHSHKNYGDFDHDEFVWKNFTGGIFEKLQTASFYDKSEVSYLFENYRLLSLLLETQTDFLNAENNFEVWNIVAEKGE